MADDTEKTDGGITPEKDGKPKTTPKKKRSSKPKRKVGRKPKPLQEKVQDTDTGDKQETLVDWDLARRWFIFGGLEPDKLLTRNPETRQLFYPTLQNIADFFGVKRETCAYHSGKDGWVKQKQDWLTELEEAVKTEAIKAVVDDIKDIVAINKIITNKYRAELTKRNTVEFREVAHFSRLTVAIYQAGMSGKDPTLNIAENYGTIINGLRQESEVRYEKEQEDNTQEDKP